MVDDEALAPPEDEEDKKDEDESDGDEVWIAPKPKTKRAPAKRKTPSLSAQACEEGLGPQGRGRATPRH